MNDYYIGPGEYDFFYLNKNGKLEKFTKTVGEGIRIKIAKAAPTRRDNEKYNKFLYMMKTNDKSYAYLGGEHYDCVCMDKNGKLSVQRHMFSPGDISGSLFEFCSYRDKNLYKVLKVTDASNDIEITGLTEQVISEGEYEVYYLGNYHETKVFDYKLEHERPCPFVIQYLEDNVVNSDVMCLIEKKTGEMFMCAADYRVEYIDVNDRKAWTIVQSCRGDRIDEVLINIYLTIKYTRNSAGVKRLVSLKFLGEGYDQSILPLSEERLDLKSIGPFTGDFEKEFAEEIKELNEKGEDE